MDRLTPRNFSIGIVSYLGRFESYFKPLIRQLHSLFPDYDINVFINGHFNAARQIHYLREVASFLQNYPRIRYVTNLEHQSLARGWNWLMLMAQAERVLILNDDLSLSWEFRHNLRRLEQVPDIFTLNSSWSHFVISKDIIRKVGWFDERFRGVGYEDGDYICRLAMHGIPLGNVSISGLANYVAQQKEAGWENFSGTFGKYARINFEFFLKKWWHSAHTPVPERGSFKVRYHEAEWVAALNESLEDMPEYYPLACLDNSELTPRSLRSFMASRTAGLISLIDVRYRGAKQALSSRLRGFFPKSSVKLAGKGK